MRKRVETVLERVRPALASDGGDVELVKINERRGIVYLRFIGVCSHCSISEITLKALIERELIAAIPGLTGVVAVA